MIDDIERRLVARRWPGDGMPYSVCARPSDMNYLLAVARAAERVEEVDRTGTEEELRAAVHELRVALVGEVDRGFPSGDTDALTHQRPLAGEAKP